MVKNKTLISIFVLLLSLTAMANTDKYRLSYRTNPATSIVIGWNQVSGNSPKVYYGKKDFGIDWKKYPKNHGVDNKTDYKNIDSRFARLTGLEAATAYFFVIKDSEGVSKRYWFKTAPDKPTPFTFIAGGDSRTHREPRRKGNKLVAKLRPLFILFGGDYTTNGTQKQWEKWFDDWQLTISDDGRMYPIIAAHGNHENYDMQMMCKLFDAPNADVYYSLPIAGKMLRIWTLNTELERDSIKWKSQILWLKEDMKKHHDVNWKLVDYHRPMRPHTAGKQEGLGRIKAWAQTFYDNGVDLVVESDTHMVKRTYPLKPSKGKDSYEDFTIDVERGSVYIGEGSWGAPTRPVNDNKPWTMASASFYQFKLIHVSKENLESRVVKFENVDEVEALTEKNLFDIPQNLSIWEPESGAVLSLPFNPKLLPEKKEKLSLIKSGSKWKYLDTGNGPKTNWTTLKFDDSNWKTGKAPLGYGEPDMVTNINFGKNPSKKFITYWFRKIFNIEHKNNYKKIILFLRRDDAAIIYLNGEKVIEDNMPKGEITPSTLAVQTVAGTNEDVYNKYNLNIDDLRNGKNIISVEIHQRSGNSSDVIFDMQIIASE
ncbi:MAG: metallophosphoesterase family protein [Verrucomicrobiota bacterium]|nr:metallophosphoesterase family protein [Verrucomicrobiota bacterium]